MRENCRRVIMTPSPAVLHSERSGSIRLSL
jgi:hypothetical protein